MTLCAPPARDELLAALDQRPTPAAYQQTARNLRRLAPPGPSLAVSLLSSFTIEPLVPYLTVEAARRGLAVDARVGSFNAVSQELVAGEATGAAAAVVVAQLLEDVSPVMATCAARIPVAEREAEMAGILTALARALAAFRRRSTAAVIIQSFVAPTDAAILLGGGTRRDAAPALVRELNARLAELAATIPDVYVLDLEEVVAQVGLARWRDERLWHVARAPLSAAALPVLARRLAAFLAALARPPARCLVLDLDDTLWGGVVGEVGVEGLALGTTYPGSVFTAFQTLIQSYRHQGVLLAISSKNNADDVHRAFASHPGMRLRFEDFAAVRINWQPKPDNVREIAEELSIGLDSLVFVDDNPAERDLMRRVLPEVHTLELPMDPLGFAPALRGCGAFDRLSAPGDEDWRRTEIYHAQQARRALAETSLTIDEFLKSLQMSAQVAVLNDASFPRAVDLLQKTNQFNLTTRRHTAARLAAVRADAACGVLTIRVVDRFGDNGIVGLMILECTGREVRVESFLLSCRVIGRGIETALLAAAAEWARDRKAEWITAEYIPTPRNAPAADCLARHGFTRIDGEETTSRWRIAVEALPPWPSSVRRMA